MFIDLLRKNISDKHERSIQAHYIESNSEVDSADMLPRSAPDELEYGDAEGQSFIVDYSDSKGHRSTRSITVWNIKSSPDGCPILVAQCHFRKQQRSFRADRIMAIYDYDGVSVEPVSDFLHETFGISPELLQGCPKPEIPLFVPQPLAPRMLSSVRPQILLLAALSLSDGYMRSEEIGVLIDYVAETLERKGAEPNDAELGYIKKFVGRLAPDEAICIRAIDSLRRDSIDEIQRFLITAKHLIEADHVLHENEIAMFDELSTELIGTSIPPN